MWKSWQLNQCLIRLMCGFMANRYYYKTLIWMWTLPVIPSSSQLLIIPWDSNPETLVSSADILCESSLKSNKVVIESVSKHFTLIWLWSANQYYYQSYIINTNFQIMLSPVISLGGFEGYLKHQIYPSEFLSFLLIWILHHRSAHIIYLLVKFQ